MHICKPSRFAFVFFSVCVLTAGVLAFTNFKVVGAKHRPQVTIRAVSLGGATLSPTIISASGTAFGETAASATITVSVATSSDVLDGTLATVDLTEASNPNAVSYNVSGGQRNNGRVWDVRLRGGGVSETIRYTITGQAVSPAGSVQFRVNLRSVTAPPNSPPPAPVTENQTTITQGLLLTFSRPQTASGNEECGPGGAYEVGIETGGEGPCYASPILVDVKGDGFSLTDADNGVDFDFNNDGYAHRVSWTTADTDDAWLALDRNGDGRISLGAELFGNYTPQPPSRNPNGFLALAEFDKPLDGGNSDGVINESDEIFGSLRLWRDANHNGISEPGELHTINELGLRKFELRYKESKRTDEYGNRFRYRAKVWRMADNTGRWAWDVFLLVQR
jgi:hypothetical protein